MRTVAALTLAAMLTLAPPAAAQTSDFDAEELGDALRELFREMQPALDQALELLNEFGSIDDPRHYQLPEVLPNGDIIIRRHPDAPPFEPTPKPEAPEDPQGTIDL